MGGLFQIFPRMVRGYVDLFLLELKLAGATVVPLIIIGLFLFVILISVWLLVDALLVYAAFKIRPDLLISLVAVLLINLIVAAILAIKIKRYVKNFNFSAMRKQIDK